MSFSPFSLQVLFDLSILFSGLRSFVFVLYVTKSYAFSILITYLEIPSLEIVTWALSRDRNSSSSLVTMP